MTTIDSDYDELYILRGQSDISSLKGTFPFQGMRCYQSLRDYSILLRLLANIDYRLSTTHAPPPAVSVAPVVAAVVVLLSF
jgi:hypothetical protein